MLSKGIVDQFMKIAGQENVFSSTADLYAYGFDASIHHAMPDIVVRVKNSAQVEAVVKVADANAIPLIPRGAGTALCGNTDALCRLMAKPCTLGAKALCPLAS